MTVNYRVHKIPLFVPNMNNINPFHVLIIFHFNIIFPSTFRNSKWFLSLSGFSTKKPPVRTSSLPCTCHTKHKLCTDPFTLSKMTNMSKMRSTSTFRFYTMHLWHIRTKASNLSLYAGVNKYICSTVTRGDTAENGRNCDANRKTLRKQKNK